LSACGSSAQNYLGAKGVRCARRAIKAQPYFLFIGTGGTFLAWPPLSEIHTDLGIKIIDLFFCTIFVRFYLNREIHLFGINKTFKLSLTYIEMCRTRYSCNSKAFGIHSNYHFRQAAISVSKNGLNLLSF